MVKCTFCDGEGTAELWVDDELVGRMCLNLCRECMAAYECERKNWSGVAADA